MSHQVGLFGIGQTVAHDSSQPGRVGNGFTRTHQQSERVVRSATTTSGLSAACPSPEPCQVPTA